MRWLVYVVLSQLICTAPKWPQMCYCEIKETTLGNITVHTASVNSNKKWNLQHYDVQYLHLLKKLMQVGVCPTDRHFNSQLTEGLLSQASVINWGWEENIPGLRLPACCPLLWPSQCFSLFRPLWAFLYIMLDWISRSITSLPIYIYISYKTRQINVSPGLND